jgi:hypothetical protein
MWRGVRVASVPEESLGGFPLRAEVVYCDWLVLFVLLGCTVVLFKPTFH